MQLHLWPIIFNHPDSCLKPKDLLNFTETSKEYYQYFLENKKIDESGKITNFLKFLVTNNLIHEKNIKLLNSFDSSNTFFDVQIQSLSKINKIFLLLYPLDDNLKGFLRYALLKHPQSPFFSRIVKAIKTESEINEQIRRSSNAEKSILEKYFSFIDLYPKIIHSLLVSGQFELSLHLIKQQGIDFDTANIEKNHETYSLIHAPYLTSRERQILIRDFLEKNSISKTALINLCNRIDNDNKHVPKALLNYLLLESSDLLKAGNMNKFNALNIALTDQETLKAMALFNRDMEFNKTAIENEYIKLNNNHILYLINKDLEKADFEKAFEKVDAINDKDITKETLLKITLSEIEWNVLNHTFNIAANIVYSRIAGTEKRKHYIDYINENKLDWYLSNYQYQTALRLVPIISKNHLLNKKIAEHAISSNTLDFALDAVALIPSKEKDIKDVLYCEIASKQKFEIALKTYECVSNKDKYAKIFFKKLIQIEDVNISKVLDLICNNVNIRLQTLTDLIKLKFPNQNAHEWVQYADQINNDFKRRAFIELLFKGLNNEEPSKLFNRPNLFYASLQELLLKGDFKKTMFFCNLQNGWEQQIVRFVVQDYFFTNLLEAIELKDIPTTWTSICNIADKTTRLPNIKRFLQLRFIKKDASEWIEFGNQIHDDSRRNAFLNLLVSSLKRKEPSCLFKDGNQFHSTLVELLRKDNYEKGISAILDLPTRWEQRLALYCLVDYFFPKKDLSKWLKSVDKIHDAPKKRDFLESFIAGMQLLQSHRSVESFAAQLLEVTKYNVSKAFDIINAYPVETTRLKLFLVICKKINLDELTIKTCNAIKDHLVRRLSIQDTTGK